MPNKIPTIPELVMKIEIFMKNIDRKSKVRFELMNLIGLNA